MTPWLEFGMTEQEYRKYQDEYANWLDSKKGSRMTDCDLVISRDDTVGEILTKFCHSTELAHRYVGYASPKMDPKIITALQRYYQGMLNTVRDKVAE